MHTQKVNVFSVVNKFGTSKKSGKEYNFYQALVSVAQRSYKNTEAHGLKLEEVFIPESSFSALKNNGKFPVSCEVKYEADFGTNRLQVSELLPV